MLFQASKGKKIQILMNSVTLSKAKQKKGRIPSYLAINLKGDGRYPKDKTTKLFSKTMKLKKPLKLTSSSNIVKIAYSTMDKKSPGLSFTYQQA